MRSDGAAWQQQPVGPASLDLAARVPAVGQAARAAHVRRLGRPSVLRQPGRHASDEERRHLYGKKPIWITEYGYQTDPPDTFFGVSWTKQAAYLRQAYEIARANPRIDLFTWFLLKDSSSLDGWQSGLITADGRKKPSFDAFAGLRAQSL